jgi:hypothetical protein
MNWEVGRVYRTRSGHLARIQTTKPLMAICMDGGFIYSYTDDGKCEQPLGSDLMEPVREQHEADALASVKAGAPSK